MGRRTRRGPSVNQEVPVERFKLCDPAEVENPQKPFEEVLEKYLYQENSELAQKLEEYRLGAQRHLLREKTLQENAGRLITELDAAKNALSVSESRYKALKEEVQQRFNILETIEDLCSLSSVVAQSLAMRPAEDSFVIGVLSNEGCKAIVHISPSQFKEVKALQFDKISKLIE